MEPTEPDVVPSARRFGQRLTRTLDHSTVVTHTHAKMLVVGAVTAVAEVGAFYLAAYLKGEDHNVLPFAIFFPTPFLLSIPLLHLLALAVIAMLAQFPIYGYLVGQAWIRGHLRSTALRLSVFHSVSVVASVCSLLIRRV